MYKSLQEVYLAKSFGGAVPPMYDPSMSFLVEGGAAGHMDHPFDLPTVTNGKKLIQLFNKVIESIQHGNAVVKIDGINASAKIVHNSNGTIEFGFDRGSGRADDIAGVTIDRLEGRFSPGHGMIDIGQKMLSIFNKTLPL